MLRKDATMSSTARDVLMKPLLSSGSSMEWIKQEINEWQDLIMDTYLKLKQDSSMRQTYERQSAPDSDKRDPVARVSAPETLQSLESNYSGGFFAPGIQRKTQQPEE
jgi:hypothetical protein